MAAIIPIPAFRDNYVWVLRDGSRAAVVDPGDAAPVIAYLEAERLALATILVTHHHADHVGGVADLAARYGAEVLGPRQEPIPARTRAVDEGDRVDLPSLGASFAVLHVPGHTRGHVAYAGRVGADDVLFCGDTMFAAGCGRLFEGTPAQMLTSLTRFAALPPATRVHCAHEYTLANLRFAQAVEPGNAALEARRQREQARRDAGRPTLPSTIAEERETNPFLRVREPGVREAVERHEGRPLADDVEAFAGLRRWKDGFG